MKYEIFDTDALGRIGELEYKKKKLITPNLIPVVHPYDNILKPAEIQHIGFNCIFTNAYILYQNREERQKVLKQGLNEYLNFNGLIATDSGAFQQYMYNKEDINITPLEIEKFQEDIGSNFPVILDIPVQPNDNYIQAKEKIELSIERAKLNILRREKECCWMGPIHGGKYSDLLMKSSREMNKLDFEIYAIGGLVKYFLDYRFPEIINILLTVKRNITPSKPLHMFGLGLPQFFSIAVACGCDLMDSAAYILYAKEQRYFTLTTGTKNLDELKEFPCNCPICSKYTPKEIRQMENKKKIKLLALHNLYISISELKVVRQAIRDGNLWELIEERILAHPNLANSLKNIIRNLEFMEIYEKIYKKHGRFFNSFQSYYRPIIVRYKQRLNNRYRIPKGVKFLLIIPELDLKGINSPSINCWLDQIKNNEKIPREDIHIAFYSDFFGLIPLELSQTYPMGQYESINSKLLEYQTKFLPSSEIISLIINSSTEYEKIAFLTPKYFTNQYHEEEKFENPYYKKIFESLRSKNKIPISAFNTINEIINYFNQ
ncbi:MAG: tRNA guanosine(15) transglycosylase TgtA [Promethearchaeati archaeon]